MAHRDPKPSNVIDLAEEKRRREPRTIVIRLQHPARARLAAFTGWASTKAIECPICGVGEGRDCLW